MVNQLIARNVEVRETKDRVEIFDGPRLVGAHEKVLDPIDTRVTDPAHRPPRGERRLACDATSTEERRVALRMPEATSYVVLLRKRRRGGTRDVR